MISLKDKLIEFANKEHGTVEELTEAFAELAPYFLSGGYIKVREDYRVYPTTVEFYFHAETGAVKEFVSVEESMMIHEPNGDESVMIRGECYPVLRIGDKYHLKDYVTRVEDGMMVITEVDGQKFCIFVDHLVGKQEIVVKPIPEYVKAVKGLSGCTQLGDGSIALIMDPAGLIN